MDERTREAVKRYASLADDRVTTADANIAQLEFQLAQAKNDRAVAAFDAQTFRNLLGRAPAVSPGYRPDLDPFTETETARMMGVV